jgi:hypothetical protein
MELNALPMMIVPLVIVIQITTYMYVQGLIAYIIMLLIICF